MATMNLTRWTGSLALLAVVGISFMWDAGPADARVPRSDPRVDSVAAFCGGLQDRFDQILGEFRRQGAGMSQADHDRYMKELREIGRAWDAACKSFGKIHARVQLPAGKVDLHVAPGARPAVSDGGNPLPLRQPVTGLKAKSVLRK